MNKKDIIKNTYYSNWADNFGYPIAWYLLQFIKKFDFITPNLVSLFSFGLFMFGSFSLFLDYPFHLYIGAILIILGYIGDDIDGQLARVKKMGSVFGDFLDKVLDVLKIYIITASLSYAVFLQTNNPLFIFLGFTACFFFNFRYYIKLETMFGKTDREKDYLDKSSLIRNQTIDNLDKTLEENSKTFTGKMKNFFIMNRTFLFVDEAEIAVIVSIGAIFNRLELSLWILVIAQVLWGFYRFYERGNQVNSNSDKLYLPMRK